VSFVEPFKEITMLKTAAAGMTALFITASPLAYAQTPAQAPSTREVARFTETEVAQLTDARVNVVKSTLQLTAEQEKLWPPIEDAIRARARDLQTRIANLERLFAEKCGWI
jgi:hypothetical protein